MHCFISLARRARRCALMGCLLAVLAGAGGCRYTDLQVRDLKAVPNLEGVVYGQIQVKGGFDSVTVVSRRGTRPVALEVKTQDDGSFCWHLPPGRYAIAEVRSSQVRNMGPVLVVTQYMYVGYGSRVHLGAPSVDIGQRQQTSSKAARTYATFDVPLPEEPPRYIGTLLLDSTERRWGVDDQFTQATEQLRRGVPGIAQTTKQLMQPEDEP